VGVEVKGHTLNLYAPSNAFAVLPVEVFALDDGPTFIRKVFDIGKHLAFEGVRGDRMRDARINGDGAKRVQGWPSYNT